MGTFDLNLTTNQSNTRKNVASTSKMVTKTQYQTLITILSHPSCRTRLATVTIVSQFTASSILTR